MISKKSFNEIKHYFDTLNEISSNTQPNMKSKLYFPILVIFGPSGSGKKSTIEFLSKLYKFHIIPWTQTINPNNYKDYSDTGNYRDFSENYSYRESSSLTTLINAFSQATFFKKEYE